MQSFTLSVWVDATTLSGKEETIIAKSRDTGNYYGIYINTSGQWVFRGPGGDVTSGASTVSQNTWTHVAVVQNGAANTRTIYVNGVAAGSGAAQAGDGTGALWMAQQNVSGSPESFVGTLDEVRLYSRALAAGEITNLMGPPVLEAQSSQTHGYAGTYGLTIWPAAAGQIEPRKGSTTGQYNLMLNFSAPVSGLTAQLTRQDGNAPVGSVASIVYGATNQVATVTLTGVGNAQALYLHVSGIAPGNGTANIPFNVLWGDANADNVVNGLDLSIVENNHTSLITGALAAYDINCDGIINSTDDSLVNAAVGTSLGPQTDTDLALFQPPTALSVNGGNTAPMAFDSSLSTRWESTQGVDPEWIYVDLGSVCTIHSVLLNWENAAGQNYNIDVSNNTTTWTTIVPVTGNSTSGVHNYPNLNTTGRYVRMYGNTRDSPYGYSLYDFQVIGLNGTVDSYAPTVNSATTAIGTVSSAFSYQITGTNTPTSYSATSLPAGLSLNAATGLISGAPTATGTSTVTISATNAIGTGSAAMTITVQTPFATWQNRYFTAAERSNPAISGPLATPAGDGITNLMKYALNLNPKVDGVSGLPVSSVTSASGSNYLTLTFTKVLADSDIIYVVEVSSDLQTWTSGSGATTTVSTTNNPDGVTQTVVVRDLTPTSSAAGRFIRLRVTLQ